MRQYKFRFWYKKENRWLDNVRIDNNGDIYPIDSNGEEDSTIDCLQVEKSQFTGLKENAFESCNKDIYESDVIEFINGERLVVEWNDDTCQFQYSDGTPINNGERYGSHKMIVGNIYENPELLK